MDPRRNLTASSFAVDDRPEEKLSYAAINLVKTGLTSRSRQQSEPPIHRSMFPPTPPPEADRSATSTTTASQNKRQSTESATSLPTGLHQRRLSASKPAKLDLGAAAFDQQHQHAMEKTRLGTKRSASERPRLREAQDTTYDNPSHTRPDNRYSDSHRTSPEMMTLRPDVYTPDTAHSITVVTQQVQVPLELPVQAQQQVIPYHQRTRSGGTSLRSYPRSIAEEDETPNSEVSISATPLPIPIPIPIPGPTDHISTPQQATLPHPQSLYTTIANALPYEITPFPTTCTANTTTAPMTTTTSTPLPLPATAICKIRVKVFAASETRYILITPSTTFAVFISLIRKKLGLDTGTSTLASTLSTSPLASTLSTSTTSTSTTEEEAKNPDAGSNGFKVKIKDEEGDMVTLGDDDDLDLMVSFAVELANKEGSEMAKMEVWVQEV
jgi:hypothetical protein